MGEEEIEWAEIASAYRKIGLVDSALLADLLGEGEKITPQLLLTVVSLEYRLRRLESAAGVEDVPCREAIRLTDEVLGIEH